MATVDGPLGDIASVVLFENEKIKVWNLIVEPGETSPWHRHDRDYVTVTVEGGGLTVEYADGTTRPAARVQATGASRTTTPSIVFTTIPTGATKTCL